MASPNNVAVFWDFENCRPSLSASGYLLAYRIREALSPFGPIIVFKAYLELNPDKLTAKSYTLHSELQSSGVSLIHCPHNGRKDVADKMMIVDMLAFAIDHPSPSTIVLITGDRDFAYASSVLRLRGYQVILVVPSENTHVSLKAQASIVLDWQRDVLGNRTVKNKLLVDDLSGPTLSRLPFYPPSQTLLLISDEAYLPTDDDDSMGEARLRRRFDSRGKLNSGPGMFLSSGAHEQDTCAFRNDDDARDQPSPCEALSPQLVPITLPLNSDAPAPGTSSQHRPSFINDLQYVDRAFQESSNHVADTTADLDALRRNADESAVPSSVKFTPSSTQPLSVLYDTTISQLASFSAGLNPKADLFVPPFSNLHASKQRISPIPAPFQMLVDVLLQKSTLKTWGHEIPFVELAVLLSIANPDYYQDYGGAKKYIQAARNECIVDVVGNDRGSKFSVRLNRIPNRARLEQARSFSSANKKKFAVLLDVLRDYPSKNELRPTLSALGSLIMTRDPDAYVKAGCSKLREYLRLARDANLITMGKNWAELRIDI